MKRLILYFILLFITTPVLSQKEYTNKGRFYFYWGWNRSWYSNSDIHFKGDNYEFKLNDLKATDRQTPFAFDPYFSLTRITLPQTNMRLGYFINDKIDISIGVDHMKYILVYNQNTQIDGYIYDNTEFDGDYNQEDFVNAYGFLAFEHTDGLNYINLEINRNDRLLDLFKIKSNPNKIQFNSLIGFGIGTLMPKSNVRLWNNERNDDFHFAGYGFSGGVGIDLILFKHLFFRNEYKFGFIDMPDIRTSPNVADRASQHFFFREYFFSFGITYNPFN